MKATPKGNPLFLGAKIHTLPGPPKPYTRHPKPVFQAKMHTFPGPKTLNPEPLIRNPKPFFQFKMHTLPGSSQPWEVQSRIYANEVGPAPIEAGETASLPKGVHLGLRASYEDFLKGITLRVRFYTRR